MALFHLLAFLVLHLVYTILDKKKDIPYIFFGFTSAAISFSSFFVSFLEFVEISGNHMFVVRYKLVFIPLVLLTSFVPSVYTFFLCTNSDRSDKTTDQKNALSLLAMSIGFSILFSFLFIIVIPHFFNFPIGIQGMPLDSVMLMTFLFFAVRNHSFLPREQESLRAASQKLFRDMREGVILLDDKGKAFLINDAARDLLSDGTTSINAEYIEKTLPGYRFDRDQEAYESTMSLKGHERVLLLSQTPLKEQNHQLGKLLTLCDVSLLREFEQEVNRSERLESLAWLAGGIAHDFNNHLQGIMSAFSIVKNSGNLPDDLQEVIDLGEKGVEASMALSGKLLTFSHGGTPLRKPVAVNKFIDSTMDGLALPDSIKFVVSLPADLPPVYVDQTQLEQVMRNLFRNSLRAMPRGGTFSISGKKRIIRQEDGSDLSPGDYVEVTVEDTGSGMTQKVLHRAFDPFFSTRPDGAGLGLAVAYSVIHRHNGSISISSSPGAGCKVTMLIPVSPVQPEIVRQFSKFSGAENSNILIMDDNPIVGKMLKMLLKAIGYESTFVRTGEEAIDLYRKALTTMKPFAAVITDLTTDGGMDGVGLARILITLDPSSRIIVSSGYSHDQVMSNYLDYGFAGVLRKPYTSDELKEVLDEVLSN